MLRTVRRPPRLYHYTDPAGLLGICTSQTLWAGRAFDMNDSEEQKQIYYLLDDEIERMYYGSIDPRKAKGARAELSALKEVNERLEAKMMEAFGAVLQTAQRYTVDMRTAAYIVAINRVATVTKMRGMYA